VDKPTFLSSEE
jgi:hypothetical protein